MLDCSSGPFLQTELQHLTGLEQGRDWPKDWLKHPHVLLKTFQVTEMGLLGIFFALNPLPSIAGWVSSYQALPQCSPHLVMLPNYSSLLKPIGRKNSPESYEQFIIRF